MEYRFLGPSGLKVSILSYGNWITNDDPTAKQKTIDLVKKCWDSGINFFDTAEAYASGQAEEFLGEAIKALNVPREELVISTKLFFRGLLKKPVPNCNGLSRKHLIEGLTNSLKRLNLEYVDIVFAHRFDSEVPMEEICRGFNHLIEKGLAFYWGTSMWTARQIEEAHKVCEALNLIKPICEQPEYSMIERNNVEVELSEIFDNYKLGTTIWSPLAGGVLTGKYNKDIPEDSRLGQSSYQMFYQTKLLDPKIKEKRLKQLNELGDLANKLGISQAQLALAWCLVHKDISTAIIGASKPEQIDDNLKAIEAMKLLTPEVLEQIEKILDNRPQLPMDFKKYGQIRYRR